MSDRPNVLFILVDEWRAQATGFAGDPNVQTPNLDQLASESVNCDQAVSGSPVCCPYRGSLITGQYPLRHGVIINDVELAPDSPSIAHDFAAAGYETAWVGKWHLYGSPGGAYERRGAPVPRSHQMGFHRWIGGECSHDYWRSHYNDTDNQTIQHWEGYDAFAQTRTALELMLDAKRRRQPFLTCLSLGAPHFPLYTAPQSYRDRFRPENMRLRPNVPAVFADLARKELAGMSAHCAALDDCLGTLLAGLAAAGLEDDTVVVFTSDHGCQHHSQGLNTKLFPFDESVRVPFLLRWPAGLGRNARTCATPVDAPDLLPSLAGLCGVRAHAACEGHDWSPAWRGAAVDPDAAALMLMPVPFTAMRWHAFPAWRALRTARHTLVLDRQGPYLFYDNVADPFQMRNLAADPAVAHVRADLERQLRQRLDRLEDPFADPDTILRERGLAHFREVQFPLKRAWFDPWASGAPSLPSDAWTFHAP